MNVISMRPSILRIRCESLFLLLRIDVMNVVSMRQSILRKIGNSFFLLLLTDVIGRSFFLFAIE